MAAARSCGSKNDSDGWEVTTASIPLGLGGLVVVRAEAVAEQRLHRAGLRRVVVSEAQAAAADVPDGRTAENPNNLRRRAAVVRHGQDMRHCSTGRTCATDACGGPCMRAKNPLKPKRTKCQPEFTWAGGRFQVACMGW